MSDFMKKYMPIYILWILFITFIAVGLQISTGSFSAEMPTGAEFSLDWIENTLAMLWNIVTFRGDGFPALLITLGFYIPSIPIVLWLIEVVIAIVDAIVPF